VNEEALAHCGGGGAVGLLKNRGFVKKQSMDLYIHHGNVEINTNKAVWGNKH
jgi:hypothetical protein